MRVRRVFAPLLMLLTATTGCAIDEDPHVDPARDDVSGETTPVEKMPEEMEVEEAPDWRASELPYAATLVSFEPGEGAGYGESKMPEVVLGPPKGKGTGAGSLDVLSLGKGGEIVLAFEPLILIDGPGDDFVVFENAFWADKNPSQVFAEVGEVAVSEDGKTWHTFTCEPESPDGMSWPGCAGWTPTLVFDPFGLEMLDAEVSGGDAFDLATIGVERARFVRIRDVSLAGEAPSAGFDLDAVGVINSER